jgi:hypothetical protein
LQESARKLRGSFAGLGVRSRFGQFAEGLHQCFGISQVRPSELSLRRLHTWGDSFSSRRVNPR